MTVAAAGALLGAVGCDGEDAAPTDVTPLEVTSEAFADGAEIPVEHTCDGADLPPPLDWSGVPEEAVEVAVVVTDPDADGFAHWVVTGIPPDADSPEEGVEGVNNFGEAGWGGPCPPEGDTPHTYEFRVVAFPEPLDIAEPATAEAVTDAAEVRAVAEGRLTGSYAR